MLKFINILWLINHVFTLYGGGKGGGDAPAAPDYTAVAAANTRAAELGYLSAADRLDFDKGIYNDAKPYVKVLQDNATATAQQQRDIAATNQKSADIQLQRYTDKGIPLENKMYDEAMHYGDDSDQEVQAGIASNQVQSSANEARKAAMTRLDSLGIRPDSGAAMAANAGLDVATVAGASNAANTARLASKDKGIALRAGATNYARGGTNAAATGFSTSIAAGNSSTGNLSTAANAGIPAAGVVDGGYAQQGQAAANGSSAAIGLGNVLNTGYGIQMNSYNQMNQDAGGGFGALVGGLASAGASLY